MHKGHEGTLVSLSALLFEMDSTLHSDSMGCICSSQPLPIPAFSHCLIAVYVVMECNLFS